MVAMALALTAGCRVTGFVTMGARRACAECMAATARDTYTSRHIDWESPTQIIS